MEKMPMTPAQASVQIETLRADISTMGANDSEFDALNSIQEQLRQSVITPEEAVRQATGVKESKQDYH
ncbi:hypothetical protein N9L26_01250 [Candidatus Pacebacteria bacterium]|nr:hypothetical protein [Candidatus Paceibacterota bacterium]